MPKVERSAGRQALERIVATGGTGAILVGVMNDSKAIAVGGVTALGSWGWLKLNDRRSGSTSQHDTQRSSEPSATPYSPYLEKHDQAGDIVNKEERIYPSSMGVSSRPDAAEQIEALEEYYMSSAETQRDIEEIREETGIYHDLAGRDVDIDTPGEAARSLGELKEAVDSGVLSHSILDNLRSIASRIGFGNYDYDGHIDLNDDNGENGGDDGKSGAEGGEGGE